MLISRLLTALAITFLLVFFICMARADAAETPDTLEMGMIDTIVVEGVLSEETLDTSPCTTNYRLYPEGRKIQLSYDFQIWLDRDTVIATHWHKISDGQWYVKLKDGTEDFCNAVRERIKR